MYLYLTLTISSEKLSLLASLKYLETRFELFHITLSPSIVTVVFSALINFQNKYITIETIINDMTDTTSFIKPSPDKYPINKNGNDTRMIHIVNFASQ